MSARLNPASNRRRRKMMNILWIAGLFILMIALIYWEKTAILYILGTLGVTALLVVVAMADLGEAKKTGEESNGLTSS